MIKRCMIIFFLLLTNYLYADNSIIIYDNFAIVNKDTTIKFQKGTHNFSIYNLPKTLSPESFYIVPIKDVKIQNIKFAKFLNIENTKPIVTVYSQGNIFKGELNSKEPLSILTADNIVITFKNYDRFELKKNKKNSINNTFTIKYNSQLTKEKKINYRFEISDISWEALYNLFVINEKDPENVIFDLNCKIKIENNCGENFENYFVKLFSGSLNNQNSTKYYPKNRMMMAAAPDIIENDFSQSNISEYYIYSLKQKVDIIKDKINFFDLLNSSKIKGEKLFFYEPYKNDKKIMVKYIIKNKKENKLGLSLPAGTIRLFKKEGNSDIKIGENTIDHIPKDEKIEIVSGFASDITANKVLKNKQKVDKNTYQYNYEITISNHKKLSVKINIKEWLSGQTFIKSSNYPFKKLTNNTYLCILTIPPDGIVKISYTVIQTY